jgi:CRISPR/Cas system-associated endonuclease Cas1
MYICWQEVVETESPQLELWARIVSGNFAEMTPFVRQLGIFYMPKICDMGLAALLPL